MFDAEIDALKREMASAKLNFDGALKRLSLGLQGGHSKSSDVIDKYMSPCDRHPDWRAIKSSPGPGFPSGEYAMLGAGANGTLWPHLTL